jgi:hypothetical protein
MFIAASLGAKRSRSVRSENSANSGDISQLGAQAEVLDTQDSSNLIQQFGCGHKVVRVIVSEVSGAPV